MIFDSMTKAGKFVDRSFATIKSYILKKKVYKGYLFYYEREFNDQCSVHVGPSGSETGNIE